MSTICKLALCAERDDVLVWLRTYFHRQWLSFSETSSEWPAAGNGGFRGSEYFPTAFSVKQVTSAVTEVHFNSFARLAPLGTFLSEVENTGVVVNIYQSSAMAGYWGFHSLGELRRAIEFGEREIHFQYGEKLPFEGREPGHEESFEGEVFTVFDDEDQDRYNSEVGIPVIVYQDHGPGWHNLLIDLKSSSKPWWWIWS